MELKKRLVHMNRIKGTEQTLFTSEGEYHLPERKPDLEEIVLQQGEIIVDSLHSGENQAEIRGRVLFEVLYRTPGAQELDCFSGSMSFEEQIPFVGLEPQDVLTATSCLEDLSAEVMHSRKMHVAVAVTLTLRGESLYDAEAATAAEGEEELESRSETKKIVELAVQKKELCPIRAELELPGNRPNIGKVLWQSAQLERAECRPQEGSVKLSGDLALFVLYQAEDGQNVPMQWLERSLPFEAEMEGSSIRPEQISGGSVQLIHKDLQIRPDEDGEDRILELKASLEVQLRLYEEEELQILKDLYLPGKVLNIQFGEAHFASLVVRNSAKCRVTEKVPATGQEPILQICSSRGTVKLDRVERLEDGLQAEGAISVTVLYLTSEEGIPFRSLEGSVPFSHKIELPEMQEDWEYRVTPVLEQTECSVSGGKELEVRATLSLETLVLCNDVQPIVENVEIQPIPQDVLEAMPGIIGYIVQPGETLWDVAKRFYTTTEQLITANHLTGGEVKTGDRLLIQKRTELLEK